MYNEIRRKKKVADEKKTGLLIDDSGKPIPGASGILVDGPQKTLEDLKATATGIPKDINTAAETVKQAVDAIPEPAETTAENVNPEDVSQDVQQVQETVQKENDEVDPTDWKSKYNELSKQMEDMRQKYADRFTGKQTDLNVTPSKDLQEAAKIDEKLSSGDDIDVDDLFNDVTGYAAGRAKQLTGKTFTTQGDAQNRQSTIPTEDIGYKAGQAIRNGFASLFKDKD